MMLRLRTTLRVCELPQANLDGADACTAAEAVPDTVLGDRRGGRHIFPCSERIARGAGGGR